MECCNKEMWKNQGYMNGEDFTNYICLECGFFKTIKTGQLEEDKLKDIKK